MNKVVARSIFGLVGLAALSQSALAAKYTYTIIDLPRDAIGVEVAGINDAGQVTGEYEYTGQDLAIGFIYTNGSLQLIPIPGRPTYSLVPSAIGPSGAVVGLYGGRRPAKPFVFLPGAKTATRLVGYPKGDKFYPFTIGANGEIVGELLAEGVQHGVTDINGEYSLLDVPGAVQTTPYLINSSGSIAGQFNTNGILDGFVYTNGSYNTIAMDKAYEVRLTYLADDGSFGGWSSYPPDKQGDPLAVGFDEVAGKVTTYAYPGATHTFLMRALSSKDNLGNFASDTDSGAYHFHNGHYYTLKIKGKGTTTISGVNASGSFAGVLQNGSQPAIAFVATCAAGPGGCTD